MGCVGNKHYEWWGKMMIQNIKMDSAEGSMDENEMKFYTLRAKLFSLNAAFESAGAGEAGASFAVSASEAGSLAMRGVMTQKNQKI